jgi:hypothetical protein
LVLRINIYALPVTISLHITFYTAPRSVSCPGESLSEFIGISYCDIIASNFCGDQYFGTYFVLGHDNRLVLLDTQTFYGYSETSAPAGGANSLPTTAIRRAYFNL